MDYGIYRVSKFSIVFCNILEYELYKYLWVNF